MRFSLLNQGPFLFRHFVHAPILSNANSTKILELEDELSTQLCDTLAGRDEIEVVSFPDDEVLPLSAWCTRLSSSWNAEYDGLD